MAEKATIWSEFEIAPIEIALPGGKAGVTLRAYRMQSEITPTDISGREDDDAIFTGRASAELDEDELPEFRWTEEALDQIEADTADDELAEEAVEGKPSRGQQAEPEGEGGAESADEEVPLFLSHQGRLLLFSSPEALVKFVRTKAPNDLVQLDNWSKLAKVISSDDIEPTDENRYELDLVVDNLRGGPDAWDADLILAAGEIARDLGHALQLTRIQVALAPGSPLDTLDEGLRGMAQGGFSAFRAKRRLKKIGAEQASLGWRTIIGKISAAVDWRD